eukprot:3384285-Alexandrium_andersonii.AAC.1
MAPRRSVKAAAGGAVQLRRRVRAPCATPRASSRASPSDDTSSMSIATCAQEMKRVVASNSNNPTPLRNAMSNGTTGWRAARMASVLGATKMA